MNTTSLISASQALSQAVAVAANNASLLAGLHDHMLAEVRGLLERNQKLEADLEAMRQRAEKAEAQLADAEAALKRMSREACNVEDDHA